MEEETQEELGEPVYVEMTAGLEGSSDLN